METHIQMNILGHKKYHYYNLRPHFLQLYQLLYYINPHLILILLYYCPNLYNPVIIYYNAYSYVTIKQNSFLQSNTNICETLLTTPSITCISYFLNYQLMHSFHLFIHYYFIGQNKYRALRRCEQYKPSWLLLLIYLKVYRRAQPKYEFI